MPEQTEERGKLFPSKFVENQPGMAFNSPEHKSWASPERVSANRNFF